MGKFKDAIRNVQDWCEDSLRRMCGRITEDQRIVVIIIMLLLFAFGSLYITISSIYNFGKGKGEEIQIQHIERMQLELHRKDSQLDSLKQINEFYYEGERFE